MEEAAMMARPRVFETAREKQGEGVRWRSRIKVL